MQNDPRVLAEFSARVKADPRQLALVDGDADSGRVTVRGWFGGQTRAGSFDDANYTSVGMSSTRDFDRYSSIIEPDGWQLDAFLKNPVVLLNHQDFGSEGIPIGKSISEVIKADGLQSTTKFAVAETQAAGSKRVAEIWALHRGGYFGALSVSFIPLEWEEFSRPLVEGGEAVRGIRYTKQEKLEHSLVTIPGNAAALTYGLSRVAVASARRFGLQVPDSELPGELGMISRGCQLAAQSEDLARSIVGAEGGSLRVRAEINRIRSQYRLACEPDSAIAEAVAAATERLRVVGAAIRSAL